MKTNMKTNMEKNNSNTDGILQKLPILVKQ